jgi:hypothetical protein
MPYNTMYEEYVNFIVPIMMLVRKKKPIILINMLESILCKINTFLIDEIYFVISVIFKLKHPQKKET